VIAGIRSEWLKMRTTAVPWVLAGVAVVITGLSILIFFLNGGSTGGGTGGGGGGGGSFGASGFPHTTQQLRNLVGAGVGSYIFALLLGTLMVTTEFRHKTVTTSFLVTPRRPRFVAAKLLTSAILSVALALILLAGTIVGGGLALAADGGSFSNMLRQVPAVLPGMLLVFALFGLLGVGVGSVLTNQVAAIIVCLGWFLILEQIIVGIWHGTARWVPSGAASAAANVTRGRGDNFGLFTWWQGALLMLFYGLVFAAIGSLILTERDIT
jgi:ABC-2 type transport system permease protein